LKRFPSGKYGRQTLRFFPAPFRAPLRAFAVLVFAWQGDRVLVCDISDRGWTVPSGRVEPDEESRQAVEREAMEEGGAVLSGVQYIGCYQITERRETRWADCYAARIESLQDIALPVESLGRKLVTLDELPATYHLWNELTERVFRHSREIAERAERR
jgi:8-oxo-dGTP diphosphatase